MYKYFFYLKPFPAIRYNLFFGKNLKKGFPLLSGLDIVVNIHNYFKNLQ